MSLVKSVVNADNISLVCAHKELIKWKKEQNQYFAKTIFGWAILHYKKCKRSITKNCPSFTSQKSYARALATTCIIANTVYWRERNDPGWKQAARAPPPAPRNGAPVKVLFNSERHAAYRCCLILHFCLLLIYTHDIIKTRFVFFFLCSKYFKIFCTAGCVLDDVRYSGSDNINLRPTEQAKRFTRYLQICCNLHRGRDTTYLVSTFLRGLRKRKKLVCFQFANYVLFICSNKYLRVSSHKRRQKLHVKEDMVS